VSRPPPCAPCVRLVVLRARLHALLGPPILGSCYWGLPRAAAVGERAVAWVWVGEQAVAWVWVGEQAWPGCGCACNGERKARPGLYRVDATALRSCAATSPQPGTPHGQEFTLPSQSNTCWNTCYWPNQPTQHRSGPEHRQGGGRNRRSRCHLLPAVCALEEACSGVPCCAACQPG